jgi:hypothetical protein
LQFGAFDIDLNCIHTVQMQFPDYIIDRSPKNLKGSWRDVRAGAANKVSCCCLSVQAISSTVTFSK